jgi:hypothetical protein
MLKIMEVSIHKIGIGDLFILIEGVISIPFCPKNGSVYWRELLSDELPTFLYDDCAVFLRLQIGTAYN